MTSQSFLRFLTVFGAACVIGAGPPAKAADGTVLITQAKALAGNVTPGDAAGFPATLSKSGSYILGSDLLPGPNLIAIVAAAPDISIDLNGFKLSGGPAGGSNNARVGILGQGDRLTVKNGTIGAFTAGPAISAANRSFLIVENMRIISSFHGIYNSGGSTTRIQNSTVSANVKIGIACGRFCQIEGNVITSNGTSGIKIGSGTILGNTIMSNGDAGISVSDPGVPASLSLIGYGNNTLFGNNGGIDQQIEGSGYWYELEPNVCLPALGVC